MFSGQRVPRRFFEYEDGTPAALAPFWAAFFAAARGSSSPKRMRFFCPLAARVEADGLDPRFFDILDEVAEYVA
jgi:hypothetical protein